MPPPPLDPRLLGSWGEERAVRYLSRRGYVVLERRFRMFRGEIDIIVRREGTIVFVEVKTRAGPEFGSPLESITPAKQRQLRKIALGYLMKKGLSEERTACRFDVLAITRLGAGKLDLVHYENAF